MSEPRLKAGWQWVKFGDVVRQVKDRVDPATTGLERYVAGEHMDTDELRIRRCGEIGDGYLGPAFHMRFRPGQVLYGSRRTYLRKVAVPDFSGICANTTFVLEPYASEELLPQFLPFLMQTEAFNEHSVKQSKGSVNPYVNFSDLAWYEFALPPADEQVELVRLLTTCANEQEAARDSVTSAKRMRRSLLLCLCEHGTGRISGAVTPCGTFPVSWQAVPLGCRYQVQLGKMISEKARTAGGHIPYIRNANVQWRRLDLSDVATMAFSAREREKFELRFGDVLACEGRHVGKSAVWRDEIPGACYQKSLHRLRRLSDQDLPEYLQACLEYYSLTGRFRGDTGETTIPHLPAEKLRALIFPFPPREEQEDICRTLQVCDRSIAAAELRVDRSAELGRQLRERIFNGSLP